METSVCPSRSELESLAIGTQDVDIARRLADHLAICEHCERLFESYQKSDPWLLSLRNNVPETSENENLDLTSLMERLDAMHPFRQTSEDDQALRTTFSPEAGDTPPLRDAVQAGIPTNATLHDWPKQIGDYRVLGWLGEGGMSVVLCAEDGRLGRKVAIKLIRDDRVANRHYLLRFEQEGKSIARLDHPHIVRVHEIGKHENRPYLALEFIDGGSLADQLRGNPIPMRASASLVAKLAKALEYAHRHGIIHRDLKPANILLSRSVKPDGPSGAWKSSEKPTGNFALDGFEPKIADFGLAKCLDEQGLTQSGDLLGTPSYLAPELTRGMHSDVGTESLGDVYSLGAILYELLTGRPPFLGATVVDTFEQVRTLEPIPPRRFCPGLPRDIETICLKCLSKEPRQRYQSAAELADDLERFLNNRPILARRTSPVARLVKLARRRPAWAALAAVSSLALVVLFFGSFLYERRLRSALWQANENAAEARLARQRADGGYRAARETLENMLKLIENRSLSEIPRLKELQRRQLEAALHFYELMSDEKGDDPRIQYDAARAAYDAGRLQDFLGRDQDARDNYQKAIDSLALIIQTAPDDAQAAAVLADAWVGLSGMDLDAGEHEAALRQADAALAVLAPFSSQPTVPEVIRSSLAHVHHRLGTVYMLFRGQLGGFTAEADLNKALEHTTASHELFMQLVADDPTNQSRRHSLAKMQVNLSIMYQQQPELFAECQRYHDLAEATLQGSLAAEPFDIGVASDLTILRVNWAFVQEEQNQLDQALLDLGDSIAMLERLMLTEPTYAPAHDALYRAHGVRAQILDSLGRFEESSVNWEGCVTYCPEENRHRMSLAYALLKAHDYRRAVAEVEAALEDAAFSENALHFWLAVSVYAEAATIVKTDASLDEVERLELAAKYVSSANEILPRVESLASEEQWATWSAELETAPEFRKLREPELDP